jgi:hypothetical protein
MQIQVPVVFFLGILALGVAEQVKGTPVQKVLEMMNEMLAKGKAEKEAETKIFDEYAEWVDDKSRETGFEIKTLKTQIEEFTAAAELADADIADLTAKIAELDAQIGAWEGDQKAATAIRDSEKAEYLKISKDYSESLDALERAITVLSSQDYDRAQAELLLQKMSKTSSAMRRVMVALLEETSRTEEASRGNGAPAVAAYEFQSGKIVGMLEKLKKKFKGELDAVEEAESNAAHAYDLEMLHLGDSIEAAKADRGQKAEANAQRKADSAEAKAGLADAKGDLAASEKFLADLTSTFHQKTEAYKANQVVRQEEIEAIAKAIEIISSPAVSGSAEKHLPTLVQQKKAVSLLQVGRSSRRVNNRERVAEMLRQQAEKLGSKVLSLAALHVGFDPFAKVITMIKELITRLEEEAAAEAAHKGFCDKELHDNKVKRDTKTAEVAELTAEKEALEADIATLAKQLEELAAAQAALAKAMKEATEIREKEKAENLQTIKDAKEAQEAVEQALTVLRDFYAKQALLQEGQVPEMKAYKGMGGAKKGVVGMLEVILSDFARLEAETTADENTAAREYDQFMSDSKADAKAKHDEEYDKGLQKDQKEHELKGKKEDLDSTQEELDAALKYYEELKPACLEVHVSYEERVAKRKEEIESLKQAYEILSKER